MMNSEEILFGRFSELRRLYGIPRSSAYILLNEGKIKSRIVKMKGSRTGIRLIDFQSVRQFLAAAPEQPAKKLSAEMAARALRERRMKAD